MRSITNKPTGDRTHNVRGAPKKDGMDVRDPLSTGRKQAARDFPINGSEPCEWRGLKNCGGGLHPIIGCLQGYQKDRHHGPVKNTLHNIRENLHLICKKCHNRWHAANDPDYDEETYADLPHSPEPADEVELIANEAYWRAKR